tara:strand:+ start:1469 stop:2770 length:1302 start_codon:yes stop_codon:yes gene_type:complete
MLSEKEKLEEELKLLKESLELDVITKEEYEAAKAKIDEKLNSLNVLEEKEEESGVKEEPKPEDEKEEEKIEIKELKETDIKKGEIKHEVAEEEVKEEEKVAEEAKTAEKAKEELEVAEEFKAEKPKEETKVVEEKAEEIEKEEFVRQEEKPAEIVEEEKGSKKILLYIAIIVILGFAAGYYFFTGSDLVISSDIPEDNAIILIACSSDDECVKEGSIGSCNNPGTENAECEYIEDVDVGLTVLNNKNCFNCDTGRVLSILKSFFPNLNIENTDIETEEGKEIAERFNVNALPAYILNSNLKEAHNYDKLSSSFNDVNGNLVMKNTVANANYYIDREEGPGKLDLLFKPGQSASTKAEENLKEFLEAFGSKVNFEKHDENSGIVKELGINTFPVFLINNKIKFSGVQPADKIRENFCQVNSVAECALGLSKSLV